MSPERHDSSLPSHVGSVAVDRRRSHRETVVSIGRLTPVDTTDPTRPMQILVTDVSLHGCDFRSAASPRDGAFYRIDVAVGPLSMTSRLRVIRIELRSDGTYEVGGEFI